MAYTINANAKNVWIRDNEDTRDLSIQTDASSVYLDNGRTLEQELGEGSMVSNVATVDSAMSKIIDGTLDGAYESLVFKGQTLVNLMTKCKDEYVVRYHDINNPNNNVANFSMMKPNTEYTLFYKAKYRTQGDGAGTAGGLKIATSIEQGFMGARHSYTTEYKQYIQKITTSSVVDCFVFASNGSYFAIKECVLLEGDYTNQDIPFFEGMTSVKTPVLTTTGKNLFDGEYELNKYLKQDGTIAPSANWATTKNYIRVKPNTTYTQNIRMNSTIVYVVFYDKNKNIISSEVGTDLASTYNSATYTTPNNCYFIKTCYNYGYVGNHLFQIEEGSVVTAYEPYKTNILRTSKEIVLREVGGVQDTYNPLTGEYVQRIGEIILSGLSSEQWNFSGLSNDGTKAGFYILSSNITPQPKAYSVTVNNKLPLLPEDAWGSKSHEGCVIGSNALAIVVNTSKLSTPDVGGIRTYLQSNPITVQYHLAEPVTTIVEPSTIPFAYKNGHIILESGSEEQSLLPTLEYSTVVNRAGQVESVAKTIQKQEKQLTMLEQMLIQNIIGLDYSNTVLALNLEINEVM